MLSWLVEEPEAIPKINSGEKTKKKLKKKQSISTEQSILALAYLTTEVLKVKKMHLGFFHYFYKG